MPVPSFANATTTVLGNFIKIYYTDVCKHFQFKNNKIINENTIQIIQKNPSRF